MPWFWTRRSLPAIVLVIVALGSSIDVCRAERPAPISLDGNWQLSTDQGKTWKDVRVPDTFEQQIDRKFDGIAWLRRTVHPPQIAVGQRLLVHFDGVATEAEVLLDGQSVGRHLGGWTPWRCDLTPIVMEARKETYELLVKVDEKVGHNTQGFLPIIAPHFGGIWQSVSLIVVPEAGLDDLKLLAWGEPNGARIRLEVPFAWGAPQDGDRITVAMRRPSDETWSRELTWRLRVNAAEPSAKDEWTVRDGRVSTQIALNDFNPNAAADREPESPVLWSPAAPRRYQVRLRLQRNGATRDELLTWAAFRQVGARGRQLLLNGQPLNVRGLLNWGYQQHGNSPSIDAETMRSELEFARQRGFNLMKFCLWVPPKRYLDLADELGMLVWMEYPAWHPQFTPQFLEPLRREYDEFFHFDRRHPCVVLRSLTCETGHGADLKVVRALYDQCRATVPNALVEDDSSWIEWNRVHDFYDDHPYGNNHTWPATLRRLNEFIDGRIAKPLMLGEAVAADTWYGPTSTSQPWTDSPSPPISAAGNRRWLERMQPLLAAGSLDSLAEDSRRYAHLMRKYQIETYRRDVPDGGYVVSVLRDFSLAGMGLIDYFDRPKTQPGDWRWHGDLALLLRTTDDRRSFASDVPIEGEILVSQFASVPWRHARLSVRATAADGRVLHEKSQNLGHLDIGTVRAVANFSWQPERCVRPTPIQLEATLEADGQRWYNAWPLWIVPPVAQPFPNASFHASWNLGTRVGEQDKSAENDAARWKPGDSRVALTRRLDATLLAHLEQGGRIVLVPDDGPGSMALRAHWFLRGGPVVNQAVVDDHLPRQMLVELQHFDLAGSVVPELQDWDRLRPLVLLWDNHDIPEVKTHGLAFELPVGKGWLLVSALRHDGAANAAGRWVLSQWVQRTATLEAESTARAAGNLQWLRGELTRRELSLVTRPWKFQPDPDHEGQRRGWQTVAFDDAQWPKIGIDRAWEAQGYPSLDGWAWYRTTVTLPADWPADRCYLNFTGVDDYYRAYVNGELVGTGGDIEKRQTAFEQRKSHPISARVRPGDVVHIAVEVYDWYGAGGIFRPITLTTTPLGSGPPLWKPVAGK